MVTLLLCNGILLTYMYRHMINEARQNNDSELKTISAFFEREQHLYGMEISELKNYLSNISNEYLVCYYNNKELYNNTVLSFDDIQNPVLKIKGHTYLVSSIQTKTLTGLFFYKIKDVSYIRSLIMQYFTIACLTIAGILIVSIIVINLIVKKVTRPLNDMLVTVKEITNGEYNNRIITSGNDEISELGEKFNIMTEAIENKISEISQNEHNKSLLIGALAHEIRTPITSIRGFSETMLIADLSDEEKKDSLLYIVRESARLGRLSKKMLALFELENNDSLNLKTISLCNSVDTAIMAVNEKLKEKNITVIKHNLSLKSIYADEDLLTEVLINILDNAINASSKNTSINIYTQGTTLMITDSGKGIPEEELIKITEPFYTVDKSRSKKNGGTGLGLAIVKMIIDKHRWNLNIESTPGEGSTFRIGITDWEN